MIEKIVQTSETNLSVKKKKERKGILSNLMIHLQFAIKIYHFTCQR